MFQHEYLSVKAIKHYTKIGYIQEMRIPRRSRDSVDDRDAQYLNAIIESPTFQTPMELKLYRHQLWLKCFFPWVRKPLRVHPPILKLMYIKRLNLPIDIQKLIASYVYAHKTVVHVPYEYSKKSVHLEMDGYLLKEQSIMRYIHKIPFLPATINRNPYKLMHKRLELHLRMKLLWRRNNCSCT